MADLVAPPRDPALLRRWLRSPWAATAHPELMDAVRDPARSRQAGRGIEVTTPVPLDAGDWATANFLAFLGEAISRQVAVEWRLGPVTGVDPRSLLHLPPPAGTTEPELEVVVEAWGASHGYGLLYHRVGPGFTTIKDTRMDGDHARYRIVDPEQNDDFAKLVDFAAVPWQDPPPAAGRELAATLLAEQLAVEVQGIAVPLPYRLRIWPVPYAAV